MAHAITDMYSNLIYLGESGCLGESFSDMMAEMTKSFIHGDNDFIIAKKCMKRLKYLRSMKIPSRYHDYFPFCSDGTLNCQESHECAAVPNYIFYRLATTPGWSTRTAGQAFLLANKLAWERKTTLHQAGCDVLSVVRSAKVNNGDTEAVINAFAAGGIDLNDCDRSASVVAKRYRHHQQHHHHHNKTLVSEENVDNQTSHSFELVPNEAPKIETNIYTVPLKITNCSIKQNIFIKGNTERIYIVNVPPSAKSFTVKCDANEGDGDIDIFIRYSRPPTEDHYDYVSANRDTSREMITSHVSALSDMFIMVKSINELDVHGLWLYACIY